MKPGKNVRRIVPRSLIGEPERHKDGSVVTIALPRGKAYPYSSVRQWARGMRREIDAIELALGRTS